MMSRKEINLKDKTIVNGGIKMMENAPKNNDWPHRNTENHQQQVPKPIKIEIYNNWEILPFITH